VVKFMGFYHILYSLNLSTEYWTVSANWALEITNNKSQITNK